MKITATKPATLRLGRRFLQVTAAITAAFLLGTTAFAGPNEVWSMTYNIGGGGTITPTPRVLTIDSNGDNYIVGYGNTGPGTPSEGYLVKVDFNGNFVWRSTLSSLGMSSSAQFTDAAFDAAGHLVVTGFVDDVGTPSIWVTAKIDTTTGNPSATWPDVGDGVGIRVIRDASVNHRGSRINRQPVSGVVVSGASDSQLIMAFYDFSGDLSVWPDVGDGVGIRTYSPPGGAVDISAPVLVFSHFSSGEYYLAGTGVAGTTGFDFIAAKFTAGGAFQWGTKYSPNSFGFDRVNDMAVDGAGHCFVTGESEDVTNSQFEMAVVRFNQGGGGIGWSARSTGAASGKAVTMNSSGAVFVGGHSFANNTMSVWKYNASGALATSSWPAAGGNPGGIRRIGGVAGDQGEDMLLLGGSLYVTGRTWDGGIQKMTTWKLNASNGNTNWIERFGTAGTESLGLAIKNALLFPTGLIGAGFTRSTSGGPDSLVVIQYLP